MFILTLDTNGFSPQITVQRKGSSSQGIWLPGYPPVLPIPALQWTIIVAAIGGPAPKVFGY